MSSLAPLPGFRRRIRIRPEAEVVRLALEDDFHHMELDLHHRAGRALAVAGRVLRAPWSTCPGAEAEIARTFAGLSLADFPRRGEKRANCTHLYDLALLAAAHADDGEPLEYDLLVSDPDAAGERLAQLARNGELLLCWRLVGDAVASPDSWRGLPLLGDARPWLERQGPDLAEAARLLRWASLIAHGRQIPLEAQSDARRMPPNCYSFQPGRAELARRVGRIEDFGEGRAPLEDWR